ncbi:MAG: hypothetical protein LAT51_09680, partial [Flavobacteriaceae bacterium]|nr:hypothetical protein [Flavobacteriaceae bacterium]
MDVKTSLAILKNENSDEHLGWADSCKKLSDRISYEIIDITKSDWLTVIQEKSYDLLLARPSGSIGFLKEMYDERLYCITKTMGYKIYPGFEECKVYENKRALAYMLKALKLKHPATHLFYHKAEAIDFSDICNFPIVGKTAIGAGGSGVRILKTKPELLSYVNQAFGSGLTRSWGPNMRKGNTFNRIKKRLGNIPETIRYFNKKKKGSTVDPQRGYVLLQEYIPCDHEWRCVVVGDSYFGH